MQPDNPYSAPQVELLDRRVVPPLPGWSARQLRVLGWLALVAVLANALVVGLTLAGAWLDEREAQRLQSYIGWLSLMLVLLGCYLLLRFKAFAEARFAARQLAAPIWSLLLVTVSLELADRAFGEQLFTALDWPTLGYMLLLTALIALTLSYAKQSTIVAFIAAGAALNAAFRSADPQDEGDDSVWYAAAGPADDEGSGWQRIRAGS